MAVAYYVVIERKCLGHMQGRRSVNKAGLVGLVMPLADGLKLFLKGLHVPRVSRGLAFAVGPLVMFVCYYFV